VADKVSWPSLARENLFQRTGSAYQSKRAKVRAPEALVKHYPELKEMVEIEDTSGNCSLLG
jgi:hypothetical protein